MHALTIASALFLLAPAVAAAVRGSTCSNHGSCALCVAFFAVSVMSCVASVMQHATEKIGGVDGPLERPCWMNANRWLWIDRTFARVLALGALVVSVLDVSNVPAYFWFMSAIALVLIVLSDLCSWQEAEPKLYACVHCAWHGLASATLVVLIVASSFLD